mgnify:CR=1 FL=1
MIYEYNATVTRVVDGDTFIAVVDLGFRIRTELTFRLADIDTPETHRPHTMEERTHGEEAKQFVIDAIEHKEVMVITRKTGKYGRWIADVFYTDYSGNKDLREELVSRGLEKREYVDGIYGGSE